MIAGGNLPYDTGTSNPVLWDDRVAGGREVQDAGDMHVPMADSCWQMAETDTIL